MSVELIIKGFFVAILSGCMAWLVFSRENAELGYTGQRRYLPYISGALLPSVLLCLLLVAVFFFGVGRAAQMTISLCFGIFLHITVYYAILLPLLPILRSHISARACAALWMLPNYLYITQQSFMAVPMPLLVIPVSGRVVWILFGIWFVGFWAVLLWKIVSHLMFRRRVLRHAKPVTDSDILAVWETEMQSAGFRKPKICLVNSPDIATPLSVGLFQRGTRVVLPMREFSAEEIALIFRHEIIHISREDVWSKFFLAFCTAMCWFNPLMWIAMRKSADDLELSCDETVLMGSDDDAKRRYANLLLRTAGDERGFSTCLSASASALRYRLKNVVNPPRKHSGALVLGGVFFVLCMSCGYVALAYGGGTGEQLLYPSGEPSQYHLQSIYLRDNAAESDNIRIVQNGTFRDGVCADEAALHSYLASLRLNKLAGNYSFSGSGRECCLTFGAPEGAISICLYDHVVKVVPLYGERLSATYYYLPEGMDWEYFDTLVR